MKPVTILYMIEEYRKNNNYLRQRIDELEIHIEHLENQMADYEKAEYKPVKDAFGYTPHEDPMFLIKELVKFVK